MLAAGVTENGVGRRPRSSPPTAGVCLSPGQPDSVFSSTNAAQIWIPRRQRALRRVFRFVGVLSEAFGKRLGDPELAADTDLVPLLVPTSPDLSASDQPQRMEECGLRLSRAHPGGLLTGGLLVRVQPGEPHPSRLSGNPHSSTGRACHGCREWACGATPGAASGASTDSATRRFVYAASNRGHMRNALPAEYRKEEPENPSPQV